MAYQTVGIDIGSGAVKLVSLKQTGNSFRLLGLSKSAIPVDAWSTDVLKNTDEIVEGIKSGLRNAKPSPITAKKAMIALPESAVFSGTFSVVNLPVKELRQALPFELAESLSINVEDYQFDFELADPNSKCRPQELEPSEDEKDKKIKDVKQVKVPPPTNDKVTIFAVAAKHSLVQSVVDLCKEAGLDIAGIDLKPNAIIRSVIPYDDKKSRIILDLGAGTICVAVAEGNALRLTSTVPTGTRELYGESVPPPEAIAEKLSPVLDELLHITKYFENRVCPGMKIEQMIVTGGGSNVPGVLETLQKETGLPSVMGNPLSRVDIHHFPIGPEIICSFSDAIGLAMRPIND